MTTITTAPCTVYRDWYHHAAGKCGEPSFATLRMACVHEHLSEERVCPGCAAELQRAGALTESVCIPCADSTEPHHCPLVVEIRWDSGEVTR